jgi:hypothetical protein
MAGILKLITTNIAIDEIPDAAEKSIEPGRASSLVVSASRRLVGWTRVPMWGVSSPNNRNRPRPTSIRALRGRAVSIWQNAQ